MRSEEIVRSWKDEDYRLNMTNEAQSSLPDNPVGTMELEDEDLIAIEGGQHL